MVEITLSKKEADVAVENHLTVPKVQFGPARSMQATMSVAMDENPDETAELQKVSKRTGVPLSTLKNKELRKQVEKRDTLSNFNFDAYTATFPDSARFLSTPEMAAIAFDDVNTIGAVETVVKKLGNAGRTIGAGTLDIGSGTLGVAQETFYTLSGFERAKNNRPQSVVFDALGDVMGAGRRGGQSLSADIMEPALQDAGFVERGIYSGVRSVTTQAPGMIASVMTRNPAYALTQAGVISGGLSTGEALDKGLDPLAAGLYGMRDAAIEVGTELLPITRFIGDMTGGSSIFRTLFNQAITEVPTELLATTLQNLNEWATLNPEEPFETYLEQLPEDLAQTLIATLTSVGVQTGAVTLSVGAIEKIKQKGSVAESATGEAASLEKLVQLAQASKVLQRDSESFENWIESMAEKQDVTDIYIDPDELAQSGVDINELAQVSPSVAKQRDIAGETGSLLKIPVSEFAAQIAPTELAQKLIEVAKVDPHSMSKREAEEFMQNSMEELQAEVEKELSGAAQAQEKSAPRRAIEENILQQLTEANRFTEDVNRPYATLLGHFYETMGERTGKTAQELFEQFPVRIQAQGVEQGAVFNQEEEDLTQSTAFKNWAGGENVRVLEPDEINDFDFTQSKGPVVLKVHHGTTHDFEVFDATRGNKESQFGAVNYFTTDRDDAEGNYAGEGPDLTIRIEIAAEQIVDDIQDFYEEFGDDADGVAALKERYGEDVYDEDTMEMARNIVRKDLHGGDEKVMDLYVRVEKPFIVGGETQWIELVNSEEIEAEALERYADDNGLTEDEVRDNIEEHQDGIDEYRWEIEANTESPLLKAIEQVSFRYGLDPADVASNLYDLGSEFTTNDLEKFLRENEKLMGAYGEDGELASYQVLSEIIEELGYDSIILKNADKRFSNMNITPNTAHVQLFDSQKTNIKSVENQGTFSPDDPNIFRQEQRGSFNPATSTITLLQAADLSTFLHESGHFFLETLGTLASDPNAPQQIKDDMQAALKWMGIDDLETWKSMSLEEQRSAHEQFARGFEAYLFKGKAPNTELQGVFQRFRAWLVNIYKELRNLNVELNDDITRVFDRLLATDEVIAQAEAFNGMNPMFTSAQEAGMTEDEWANYQKLGEEATAEAKEKLDARSLRDMRWLANAKSRELKRLQRETREKRKAVREEVEIDVMSEPVNQAYLFITKGEYVLPENPNKKERRLATEIATGEGSTKMSLASLREFYGEADTIWQNLPTGKYGLVSKEGMDFNIIAELFGYGSGDAMLKDLINREDAKTKIEALTDLRMLERYGDINSPEALERMAEQAVHNEARARFVATEMVALQKATGGRKVLADAARQLAERMIGRLRVRDVKPSRYTAAEAKAAREAVKAQREGDLERAAMQKRNQLVQLYASRAAIQAREQIEKDLKYLKKFDKDNARKTIDVEYLDQIDTLLGRFDLKKSVSLKTIDKRKSLLDWIAAQEEAGLEPDIPPELLDVAYQKHYKDMSVEELRGLVDTVRQIEHLGRLKKKLLTLKDKRELNKVIEDLVDSIYKNAKGKTVDNTTRATKGHALKALFRGYLAQHRKISSLSRQMDGAQDGGQMWEVFIRSMNEAGDKEALMREEATVKLAKISEDVRKLGKMGGKGTYFPTLGRSLNREERLSIVLNMGNEGNLQRLLDGKGWTYEAVQPVLDTLTAEEVAFVQEVWDLFESYRPQIAEKERRIYGKEPEWVEPAPLETRHGTLRGGYYPIKYDTRQSAQAEAHDAAEKAKQQLKGAYTSSTTRRSFTKSRADEVHDRPLLLTMDGLYGGLNEVIHDLAWHEWLIDANRLLRSKRLTSAILETQGAEVLQQFKEAVKDIAAGEMAWTGSFEKVSAHLRTGATVAGIGLSISTSLINVTGLSQSFVRVGPRWIMQGIGEWTANPLGLTTTVHGKSEFMRLRGKTMQREINEIQSLLRDKSKTREAIDRYSFLPIVMTQIVVDVPTWWGAYQKALAEGNAEDRAIALADQAVLDAQGGGQVKDLAEIQRSKVGKLFTVFYSYFSTTYQLTVEQTSKTNFKDPLDVMRLGGDYFMLYVLPAFLGSIIRGAISGDDDWAEPEKLARAYANEQLSFVMAPLVGLRELTPAAQTLLNTNDYTNTYTGPAALRFYGEVAKLAQQVEQGEIDKALIRSTVNVGGIMLRLPSAQTNRTIDGMWAIMDGDTQNPASVVFGAPRR